MWMKTNLPFCEHYMTPQSEPSEMCLYSFVLSANIYSLDFITSSISFMYLTNNNGPSMDPCGVTLVASSQAEAHLFMTTRYRLLSKNLSVA